jgi:hypothetical protein
MLLKVVFNTNKTGHHVIRYNWLIVESDLHKKIFGHHVIRYTWHIVESETSFIGV